MSAARISPRARLKDIIIPPTFHAADPGKFLTRHTPTAMPGSCEISPSARQAAPPRTQLPTDRACPSSPQLLCRPGQAVPSSYRPPSDRCRPPSERCRPPPPTAPRPCPRRLGPRRLHLPRPPRSHCRRRSSYPRCTPSTSGSGAGACGACGVRGVRGVRGAECARGVLFRQVYTILCRVCADEVSPVSPP